MDSPIVHLCTFVEFLDHLIYSFFCPAPPCGFSPPSHPVLRYFILAQCVTRNLNDTDSETFFGTKIFRDRFRDFSRYQIFSETGSGTFFGTKFFQYRSDTIKKGETFPGTGIPDPRTSQVGTGEPPPSLENCPNFGPTFPVFPFGGVQ